MIDIQLLRVMKVRSDFNRIIGALDITALEEPTRSMVKAVKKYYDNHPSHGKIDFGVFIPYMKRNVFPGVNDTDWTQYKNIAANMAKYYPDAETRQAIIASVHELNLVHKAFQVANSYHDGKEIDPVVALSDAMDNYKNGLGKNTLPEVSDNVDFLVDDMENDGGVHFRLPSFNETMRGLRGGDFIILAARPDQGKTSFLCSESTFMAPQLPKGEPLVWLNNEGPGYAIIPRLMQAALNVTTDELVQLKKDGDLYDEYYEAIGGKDRIRVMDVHGFNNYQVEQIMADLNPGFVIYDMIDNIHGFDSEARTDLQLERMYQWAREKAVKYDAIGLATSQISAEGIDLQYPGLGMLKDSKTGKQGACDAQIMMGSMETKPEFANTRWFSLPKNKLRKMKSKPLLRQVEFDRERARFKEIV